MGGPETRAPPKGEGACRDPSDRVTEHLYMRPGSQRYAAVHLWALPIERAFGLSALSWPCAVKKAVRGRTVLTHVNDVARAAGVRPGMTAAEGKTRAPALEIRDRDPEKERHLLEAAAESLLTLSSEVEAASPDVILLELGRSTPALVAMGLADEQAVAARIREMLGAFGHDVTVAIADDIDTARTLAHARSAARPVSKHRGSQKKDTALAQARPSRRQRREKSLPDFQIVIAEPGRSAEALTSLPIEALLWTDAELDPNGWLEVRLLSAHASLRVLGVQTVGQLAAFPIKQVKSRFEDAGVLLIDRALGQLHRPLRCYVPPEKVVELYDLDEPIDALESVLFVLKRLFDRIEARLYARGRAADSARIVLTTGPMRRRERLKLKLNRPSRSSRVMLRLAQEKLAGALAGAVWNISIEVTPVADLGSQLDLFSLHEQRVEKVEELIDRLRISLGEQAVFAASLRDSHRPEAAWGPEPFEPARALREVQDTHGAKRAKKDVSMLRRTLPTGAFQLPSAVNARSIIDGAEIEGDLAVAKKTAALDPSHWPKAVARVPADEPLPPLPPRPLELFEHPEPARLHDGVLAWRGRKLAVLEESSAEQLSAEWWTQQPLERTYRTLRLTDGRLVWVFEDLKGRAFVHGVFD